MASLIHHKLHNLLLSLSPFLHNTSWDIIPQESNPNNFIIQTYTNEETPDGELNSITSNLYQFLSLNSWASKIFNLTIISPEEILLSYISPIKTIYTEADIFPSTF
jgi:hypothetical protein